MAVFEEVATHVPVPDQWDASVGWFAAVLGLLALFAWMRLLRPALELAAVPLGWLLYRIRPVGPGLAQLPARGPCLVIANHACWSDPLFLGKLLPRPITPMMTSKFYDLPVLSWLMRRVIRAIRVQEKAINKQDVPDEVKQAIAALDRGECLVVFPEGSLRRTEEVPLKRFGRGVWHILAARPETPVFACWIEGGWGSYFSYRHGKPTTNKRPDLRRPIAVAFAEPVTLDADTLANHLRTRLFLMNRVADARKLLGLPPLPPFELPKSDDEAEG
jgi:1-acyl-sn-glycerol-3-phosphate acyltransferase